MREIPLIFLGAVSHVCLCSETSRAAKSQPQTHKGSSSIFPLHLPSSLSSNIEASELDPNQCRPPINVGGSRAVNGADCLLLGRVVLPKRVLLMQIQRSVGV